MASWKKAFTLSKQELAAAEPPGTVKLIDHALERTLSGNQYPKDHVRLVPEPSQSGLDPLNWPLWRKYAILLGSSFYAAVADFTSAAVAPALPIMAYQMLPPRSFSDLTHLISVNVVCLGGSSIFWVPLTNVIGRRPVLVLAPLIMTLGSMWCGLAGSFGSLLAARAIQGFGGGPADTVAPDILGEVFFVHQRGRAMAIYTFFLAAGSYVGGVSGGYIAARLGSYTYIFWISTALSGAVFLFNLLLVPETSYDRKAALQYPESQQVDDPDAEKVATTQLEEIHPDEKLTFTKSLRVNVYRGDWIRQFTAPWKTLRLPGVWVVMLQYSGLLGGIVTVSTVGPIFLSVPPYLWGPNVGLLSLGGVVGTVLGVIVTYAAADRLLLRQAAREGHGLAEPESRLVGMVPALFLSTTGLLTFGFCAANPSPHAWAGLVVGLGMISFGIVQIPSIGFNYLIEAYYAVSGDCLVMVTLLRAIVSFSWTFFVGEWVAKAGPALPFGIFGMLMGVFSLLVIPLWMFGKRMRVATTPYLPENMDH